MSTDLSKFRPPLHRRYNWFLVARHQRWGRKIKLIVLCGSVATLIYMGEMYLIEYDKHAASDFALASFGMSFFKLSTFGAPGYVRSDWVEGTAYIETRKHRNSPLRAPARASAMLKAKTICEKC